MHKPGCVRLSAIQLWSVRSRLSSLLFPVQAPVQQRSSTLLPKDAAAPAACSTAHTPQPDASVGDAEHAAAAQPGQALNKACSSQVRTLMLPKDGPGT